MGKIKRLPEADRNTVRSGIFLFDLTRVVEELVFNCLGAGATKVSVFVGVGSCYVKVVDNGSGISRDGLELLGERYAISKLHCSADADGASTTFGFRGEALASIANVSLLEIITKAHGRPNGYCKVMKGSECLYLQIDEERKDVGTTVVAHDLFYNQPVRQKIYAIQVLHSVKKCILRIALVHSRVSFNVADLESEDELLSTCSSSSPLSLLTSGFGIENSRFFREVNANDGVLKISGYISSRCASISIKDIQYVYINSRFVCKGPIHKLLNHLAYILNLHCLQSLYDLNFEPSKAYAVFKDWEPVITFVKNAIHAVWTKNIAYADKFGEDEMWKKHGNIISAGEADKSEDAEWELESSRFKNCQASLHLPSSPFENLTKECNNLFSEECSFLAAGRLSTHVDSELLNSQWEKEYLKVESGVSNGLLESSLCFDGGEFSNQLEVSKDMRNPFLQSCSSEECLPFGGASFAGEEGFESSIVSFKNKRKRICWDQRIDFPETDVSNQSFDLFSRSLWQGEASSSQQPPRLMTKRDIPTDTDILSRASQKLFSSYASPFSEETNFLSDSFEPVENSGSDHQSLNSKWRSKISDPFSHASSWDDEHFTNINTLEENSRLAMAADRRSADAEENCKFSYDFTLRRPNQECNSASTGSDFSKYDYFNKDFCKFLHEHNLPDQCSPEHSDMLTDETERLCSVSCSKNFAEHDSRRVQTRYQNCEPNPTTKERSRRGCSAPPFHRLKRKYISLNHCSMVQSGKPSVHTFHGVGTSPEAGELKHLQLSSGVCHINIEPSPAEDLVFSPRPCMKKSNTPLDMKKTQKGEKFRRSECAQAHHAADVEDFISKEIQDSIGSGIKWRNSCLQTTNKNVSCDIHHEDTILDISSGLLHLVGDLLVPQSIKKKCLEDAKVLQQVDKKFIPVVAGGTLAIIDQHAADERIRLEELRQKVLSGEGKTVTYLDAEQELVLPEIGYQLLDNYAEQLKDWGWICNIHTHDSRSFKKSLNILHQQPTVVTLLVVPCILGVNLSDVDLLEFLQQLSDTDGSSAVPPSVRRVLNSKACRGAIMFGDPLLPSECALIVEELKQTSLCFQVVLLCAHGRPTTVPLVNLEALHK